MQTCMVLAPAVAPLLEYDRDGTLSSLITRPFKERECFSKVINSYIFKQRTHLLRYSDKLTGLKSELQDVTGGLR